MVAEPGADERRIRQLLLQRGVGPDAPPRPARAARPPRTDAGWWDDLYDTTAGDTHARGAAPGRARIAPSRLPDWRTGETADLSGVVQDRPDDASPDPDTKPVTDPDTEDPAPDWTPAADPDDPVERPPHRPANPARAGVRRASAAYLTLAPRTRVLLYNGTAAATGWALGLEPLMRGWITQCGHDTGHTSAALILGVGMTALIGHQVDRRTRHWWPPLAWVCRIPLASALLALGLYAPGTI